MTITPRDLVQERLSAYGAPEVTFAWVDKTMMNLELMSNRDLLPGEQHAIRQILMKIVRAMFSPENQDHYTDIIGYTQCWERITNPIEDDK